MSIKLSKTELRIQQTRLGQLQKYLPTLQLKKAMLQFEVIAAEMEVTSLQRTLEEERDQVNAFAAFLVEKVSCNVMEYADVLHVKKHYENVAGVEIPIFEKAVFREASYSLFDTPVWTDQAIALIREMATCREKLAIAQEKMRALSDELRDVSIRVNLFEKILIPRSLANINKIRIFLGDQQLAAVAQAKVAKRKIAQNRARNQ